MIAYRVLVADSPPPPQRAAPVSAGAAMIAAILGFASLAFCPGHRLPLSRSSQITLREPPAVMQFDDVTKRSAAPPAQKAESPEDDSAGVERGVRALGFLVGGLSGNVILSVVEGLTSSGSAPTPTPTSTVAEVAKAPFKNDGLYNSVLPLFETGVIPSLSLPSFAGGDTVRAVNSKANEKYKFMFPAAEAPPPAVQPPPLQPAVEAVVQPVAEAAAGLSGPTGGSLPDDGMTQLQQLQQQLQQLQQLQQQQQQLQQQPPPQDAGSAALSQLQDTGSSALSQLAAALSPLPQPALAADVLPPGAEHAASSLGTSSVSLATSLDSATFALASGAGGVGLLAHLLVPLLFGVLGAVGFDVLSKQDGGAADVIRGGGKLVDQAGQTLWASVQGGQEVPASNTGSQEVPARRRMPWEEDGDLQRQWEEEQKDLRK